MLLYTHLVADSFYASPRFVSSAAFLPPPLVKAAWLVHDRMLLGK
jgi:hypothetical protein